MPPTRRRSGNTGTTSHKAGQPTLNFGNKSRVSKPSSRVVPDIKNEKPLKPETVRSGSPASPASTTSETTPDQSKQPAAESSLESANVVHEQAKVELQQPKSEEDVKAEKLTDEDIRKYWQAEEKKRRAPRVHQEDLSMDEKILRHFDLCSQYGPCVGIARIKRWRRAHNLGLDPPLEVLAVLLRDEAKGVANERAYIDELLS